MPPAPRARQVDNADLIRQFAEHHILGVRKARRSGEIVSVHHIAFGWITPQQYYLLDHLHNATGILEKIVEGGYRVKAALWGLQATVGPVSVPVGLLLPVFEAQALNAAIAAKNPTNILIWSYALAGPFGDVLGILSFLESLGGGSFLDGIINSLPEDTQDEKEIKGVLQKAAELARLNPLTPAVNFILSLFGAQGP